MDLFSDSQPEQLINLLDEKCETYLWKNFFTHKESERLFESLITKSDWQQDEIKIYGKLLKTPRLSAWYADAGKYYSYSKIKLSPKPWFDELIEIKERIESQTNEQFNSVLLNLYRN